MTPADILDRAAVAIERNGWHQNGFFRDTKGVLPSHCAVCVLGAINVGAGHGPSDAIDDFVLPAIAALADHLDIDLAAHEDYIVTAAINLIGEGWNDRPDRTAEEVVRELRAAAGKVRRAR